MSEVVRNKYLDENESKDQEASRSKYPKFGNEEITVSYGSDPLNQIKMDDNHKEDEIEPREFIRENRDRTIAVTRSSDNPLTRSHAWALQDKHPSDARLPEKKRRNIIGSVNGYWILVHNTKRTLYPFQPALDGSTLPSGRTANSQEVDLETFTWKVSLSE